MPKKISTVIDQVAQQTVGKDWPLYAALLEHWQEIVGTEYARVTTPVKITFPHQPQKAQRSHGLLHVRLPQGLAMEFSFKTEQIKQRINGYFGYEAFARIVFEPAHITPHSSPKPTLPVSKQSIAEIEKNLEDLPPGELRTALTHFGETLLSASPSGWSKT